MKKVLTLVLLLSLVYTLVGCNKKKEVPIDVSDLVTVEFIDDAMVFNTADAEEMLNVAFYTVRNMSSNVISLKFYNANGDLLGYANVNINDYIEEE